MKYFYPRIGKRLFDITFAGLGVLTILPILIVTSLVVRLKLGRGIIYRQSRTGYRGEDFEMLKFRTMEEDRRKRNARYSGIDRRVSHKREDDPRHTPVGKFLRKYSIDELPQLINVIRGEMSMVGPRPELATIVEERSARNHPRHAVRPGITGLWQVTTRQEGGHLADAFDDDLEYLDTISLRTDLRILWQTIRVIAGGSGR